MDGMNTQERINDICTLSGLSEEIVRRVIDAERKSVVKSLRNGEKANLIGRVVIKPEIRTRLEVGGNVSTFIKLSSKPTASLESLLADIGEFEDGENEIDSGIRINQIDALN